MSKQNQRLHVKELLSNLTDEDLRLKSQKIYHILIELLAKLDIPENLIGVYVPIKGEVDLFSAHEWSNFNMCIPHIEDSFKMSFYSCEASEIGSLSYKDNFSLKGDLVTPKIIIVPGLGFDKDLNRLGRGKGYYDRYLSDEVIKIGVCFNEQVLEKIEVEKNDIKMNYIITENTIFKGNK